MTEKKTKTVSGDKTPNLEAMKNSLVPGMTVRIYQKIKELNAKGQEKEREQYFEGLIIARKHGREVGATVTVAKKSEGVEVEKIFPLSLPTITKIEVKKQAQVRRAKLTFLKKGYKKNLKAKK
jgi:large subunit ribosomal protein L19